MSSRFEQRPSRSRDAAAPIALVRPVGDRNPEGNEVTSEERPWQAIVRKLRQLMAIEDVLADEADATVPNVKHALRLLPGGRIDDPEEQRRSTVVTRGKWH